MPSLHAVAADVRITACAPALDLPADVRARVDALWEATAAQRPHLYDGPLFDMTAHTPERIEGRFVRYRHWMALRADPTLRDAYGITPLAVTGVTRVEGDILLGRRAAHTTQDAGLWELVPAGSIDRGGEDGGVDPQAVLLAELHEELGIERDGVAAIGAPLALAEDEEPGVWDLVLPLELRLTKAEVERAFAARTTDETTELRYVADASVPALLSGAEADALAPVSRCVLEALISR